MLRYLTAVILLISLLASSLCLASDHASEVMHDDGVCSISTGCQQNTQPCHDGNNGSHSDHCCDTHSHLQAVAGHLPDYFYPIHDKQFTSVVPHLVPQDFSRIPFIPPRIIS